MEEKMGSIFTVSILQSALELGFIYSLVVLALFVSFSILNIADLSTDGCFTLGCAVAASVTLSGHPILALFMAMGAAGLCAGSICHKCGSGPFILWAFTAFSGSLR